MRLAFNKFCTILLSSSFEGWREKKIDIEDVEMVLVNCFFAESNSFSFIRITQFHAPYLTHIHCATTHSNFISSIKNSFASRKKSVFIYIHGHNSKSHLYIFRKMKGIQKMIHCENCVASKPNKFQMFSFFLLSFELNKKTHANAVHTQLCAPQKNRERERMMWVRASVRASGSIQLKKKKETKRNGRLLLLTDACVYVEMRKIGKREKHTNEKKRAKRVCFWFDSRVFIPQLYFDCIFLFIWSFFYTYFIFRRSLARIPSEKPPEDRHENMAGEATNGTSRANIIIQRKIV